MMSLEKLITLPLDKAEVGSGVSVAAQSQMRAMGLYLPALGVVCRGTAVVPTTTLLSGHTSQLTSKKIQSSQGWFSI